MTTKPGSPSNPPRSDEGTGKSGVSLTDSERIARLEYVLGRLITWLCPVPLSLTNASDLIGMLEGSLPTPASPTDEETGPKACQE